MKKVLSLALVLVMLLGITVPVYAADISDVTVNITNISNSEEGICVEWYKVVGADSYNIYRRAGGESEPSLIAANVTETIYTDESAESGTYYMYFVSAVIGDNESEKAESRLIKFLSVPTNVKLSIVSNGIKVEWDAVPGADSYRVYYRVKGAEEWSFVASPKATSCVVKPNVAGSTFEVTIISCSGVAYRSTFNQTGYSITQVNTPKITLIENTPEGIHITWNNVSNTCKYRVYRRAAGEKYWTYLETVTGTREYYDDTAKSGVYYSYTVVAEEDGQRSPVATSNPVIKYVATPKLQAVANGTDGSYIRWETVAGATKYVIYRRGAGETTWTQMGQVTSGNRFKDTTTMWGQYYRYTVVAVSGNYKSGFDKNGLVIKFLPLGGTWNNTVIFNFYKGAVTNAKDYYKCPPAYVAKMWQNAGGVNFTGSNREFVSEFQKEFRNAFRPYSNAFTVRPYRGTANASEYLPYCYANASQVKSASVVRKGGNYSVKIVFKDLGMPTETNYGVAGVCPMYYNMQEDVRELYRQDLVSSYTASTVYKDYTITAEITPDGKLVNMTHMAPGYVNASMNFVGGIGNVKASGKIICYASYTNFQY
ncbi:MAG: hypothetical protein J6D06_06530 [Clostridia bacterium]|nr:hypothetical protein [Clostridia bacterium]